MRHNRWFRVLALLLPLVLLAAACGDDDDTESTTGDTTEDTAGDGEGGGDSDLSVGVVYDLGGRGDQSFNDAAAAGLDRAVDELGISAPQELEPDEGGENREELLRLLAEEGTNLVFAVGFLFADSVTAIAPEFPDSTFGLIDSVVEEGNVASLVFAEEEGSFLVGAAAALTSQTGKVGFLGGVEIDLIKKFEAGFVAGAKQVNPDIEIDVKYISQPPDFSGFNDPAKGKEAAKGLYAGGADIVYHAAGGSGGGLFDAAVEGSTGGKQLWAIGVDSDQYQTATPAQQKVILTSMIKKVNVAVYETAKEFRDGNLKSGVQSFDLKSGGVDYSTSGGYLDDIKSQIDSYKQKIISGEIKVPTE